MGFVGRDGVPGRNVTSPREYDKIPLYFFACSEVFAESNASHALSQIYVNLSMRTRPAGCPTRAYAQSNLPTSRIFAGRGLRTYNFVVKVSGHSIWVNK